MSVDEESIDEILDRTNNWPACHHKLCTADQPCDVSEPRRCCLALIASLTVRAERAEAAIRQLPENLAFDLSVRSGVLLLPWPRFHARAEKLLGRPIYTHEFASDALSADLVEALDGVS